MDTKAFFPALQHVAQESKTIDIYAVIWARWWPLLLLFSAFCVISGCDRKIPEPGEPIIERQDEKAAPGDRTQNQDDNPGADR